MELKIQFVVKFSNDGLQCPKVMPSYVIENPVDLLYPSYPSNQVLTQTVLRIQSTEDTGMESNVGQQQVKASKIFNCPSSAVE